MRAACGNRRTGVETCATKPAKVSFRLFAVVFTSCLGFLLFSCSKQANEPPRQVTISMCPELSVEGDWLLTDSGLRFHVPAHALAVRSIPTRAYTVKTVHKDMPPSRGYIASLNGYAGAKLVISPDKGYFRDLEVSYPTFSETNGQRALRDSTGRSFGTDHWGYLPCGERWRYVSFSTGDRAGYEPVPSDQADKLDEAINSACFLRDNNLNK
jgi:hypothetical protein